MTSNIDRFIPTYVINLKSRTERRKHILKEFGKRNEFQLNIIEAKEHESGAMGLWNSITFIISKLVAANHEYILICEDDHLFINQYDKDELFDIIDFASKKKAEILLAGVSWFSSIFGLGNSLYWVESFNGTQFMIIFKRAFKKILLAQFTENDNADIKISRLFSSKFIVYPFISIQKGFGYSDVTSRNANSAFLSQLFTDAEASMKYMIDGEKFYKPILNENLKEEDYQLDDKISIRAFLVHSAKVERTLSLSSNRFEGRGEFDVKLKGSLKSRSSSREELARLREIIQLSIKEKDGVIVYCNSLNKFSKYYDRNNLIRSIVDANRLGIDIIYGSEGGDFTHALPLSKHFIWIDRYTALGFIIIFKSLFLSILQTPMENEESLGNFVSRLSSNKILISPPILQSKVSK